MQKPGEKNMKLHRRNFLHLAAGAAALPAAPHIARAQAYPSRGPVRIIVGFAAGGPNDILARLMGQWLSERLGQTFVVENKPGASGNIATELVARSAPDGYTLMTISPTNAVNATLYEKLSFDFVRDIAPVATIFRGPFIVAVNPSVPVKTVPELIAYAKANPNKLNYASVGNGSPAHLGSELLKMMTGIKMVHIPYRGGAPAITDTIAGQVQLYLVPTVASIEYIRAGKIRALAVTTKERSEAFPDLPSISETVPGFESSIWFGIGAPKNTPPEIVNLLNKEINAGLANPKIKQQLAKLGGTALIGSPADFGKLIADETAKWAKVIKFAGIKPQ
jgi:tripartite-type tricarboxylate transporter receptor subunit TctC